MICLARMPTTQATRLAAIFQEGCLSSRKLGVLLFRRLWLPKNPIQPEMTLELANHIIIPGHAGNDRTAGALAVVAGEVAPPARS
jgi:hypothetical protein